MHSKMRRLVAVTGTLALAAGLAACSSDAPETTADEATSSVDLAAAGCPATIVVQTDWNPESEHGHLYEMFGDDAVIDDQKKSISGNLMLDGESTGVKLEVRAGGPAIGFTGVGAQMYTDTDITMGYITTDDQISSSAITPTKAFFAPLDLSPIMVMYDPATYPDVTSIDDLHDALLSTGGVWRFFQGSAYMEYLEKEGIVAAESMDPSYDGTAALFVTDGGKSVQQGFSSAEPYIYENEITEWNKPVGYFPVSDTGWSPYQSSMAVRSADFDELSPCLKALTPVLQQTEVDYFADPTAADALIQKLVEAYDTGWEYSPGVADYSRKTMIDDKLVGNADNSTLGDFSDSRMSDFFALAQPVFEELKSELDPDLKVEDLYTNEFIDDSIGLP